MSKTSNHERAPLCAAFVQRLREYFPDLQVLCVCEGEVRLGEEDKSIYASCYVERAKQ